MSHVIRFHPRPRSVGRGVIRAGLDRLPGAALTVTGGGSFYPNEPAGYVEVYNDPMSTTPVTGATLYSDATAPLSPPTVTRVTYPAGYTGGDAPTGSLRDCFIGSPEAYVRMATKYSSNWQGHSSTVNKLGFVWIHNNPSVVIVPLGSGTGNLPLDISLQNCPEASVYGRYRLPPNLGPTGYVTRGVWHIIELQIIANTPGVRNGIVRAWLDGVQTHDYTNIEFAGVGESNIWEYASLYPIWGGEGDTVTNTMTLDYDDWYVSSSEGYTNEPAGYSVIVESGFPVSTNGYTGDAGYFTWYKVGGTPTVVTVNEQGTAAQFTFPSGEVGGDGYGVIDCWDTQLYAGLETEYREIYESTRVRIPSADFETNQIGVKFLGYWGVGITGTSRDPAQIYCWGIGNGSTSNLSSWSMNVSQQGPTSRTMGQNVDTSELFVANEWVTFEYHMVLNDIGSANGILKMWINGTLTHNYSDVVWRTAGSPAGFFGRRFYPIWGGGGGSKSRTDYLQIDHTYVSGVVL